jgi:NAD+ synthase (glutamine-hydrolysing)
MRYLRVAAAQINTCVGDLEGNAALILEAYDAAESAGAQLIVFPELTITGYPPEDLLFRAGFVTRAEEILAEIQSQTRGLVALVGFPQANRVLHNAAAILAAGKCLGVYQKNLLPNYAVFDEERYFQPGVEVGPLVEVDGIKVGVSICEDVWSSSGPVQAQADGGAQLLVNLNASPYHFNKDLERESMLATRAADAGAPLVYCNLVGGQDELVFDGASLVFDGEGQMIARAKAFADDLLVVDVPVDEVYLRQQIEPRGRDVAQQLPVVIAANSVAPTERLAPRVEPALGDSAELYQALVLGTRDYVTKNGFTEVVIGMSGGIDSTLVTTIAVDALGADRVHGISMPSRYSSDGSVSDAEKLAMNLGIDFRIIPIEPAHAAIVEMLRPSFEGLEADVTEENIQSRVRGVTWMALSNKFGWMVLTCSNKSEAAVGYATLYGDTAGGFAVIKDVPKLVVYELCRYRNSVGDGEVIPVEVLTKPPSAELRPDQRDDQSLPAYEVLDPIIEAYVDDDMTRGEIIAAGHDPETVHRIARLIDLAEYKRRQSPPGPRISSKAFGKDRRIPITNRFRG